MRVLLLTVLLVTLLLIVEAGRGDAAKEKAGGEVLSVSYVRGSGTLGALLPAAGVQGLSPSRGLGETPPT